jgi:hypothetical protein
MARQRGQPGEQAIALQQSQRMLFVQRRASDFTFADKWKAGRPYAADLLALKIA